MKTSYHQQHNHQRHFSRVLLILLVLSLVLAALSGVGVLSGLAQNMYASAGIGIRTVEQGTEGVITLFTPKPALVQENQNLRSTIKELRIRQLYNSTLQFENYELRRLLTATETSTPLTQSSILARVVGYKGIPYGTLLVSAESDGAQMNAGDLAHFGEWAIGTVAEVTNGVALINLFTASDNAYDVLVGESVGTFIGTSNGTGKIMLPRDADITIEMPIALPSAKGFVLGEVEAVAHSDEEALQTVLVRTPFNINTVRFITIDSEQ